MFILLSAHSGSGRDFGSITRALRGLSYSRFEDIIMLCHKVLKDFHYNVFGIETNLYTEILYGLTVFALTYWILKLFKKD